MANVSDLQTVQQAQPPTLAEQPSGQRSDIEVSLSTGRAIRLTLTYSVLFIGAAFMFFPMLWMLGASLKPEWQILTQPLAIPSEWIHAQAGETTMGLPVWSATDLTGEREEVIDIGVRRYTTVIEATALTDLISVPRDQLSDAETTEVDGVVLNVRTWTAEDGSTQQVVALARDGDNLVVAPVDSLAAGASRMSLADVNTGSRARLDVGDYTFQAREVGEDGQTVLPLGPESQLTVVGPREIADDALLVPTEALGEPELVPLGNTELLHYPLLDENGEPTGEYYILLSSETWRPVIEFEDVENLAFVVENGELAGDPVIQEFELAPLPVDQYTAEDGSEQDVVVLLETMERSLVIPLDDANTIRLSPLGSLSEPFVASFDGFAVRYKDDYMEHGERHTIGIIGERFDMALVVPQESITEAFDVPSASLERVVRLRFYYENFLETLSKDLGGANFFTFFGNSILLVILNMVGHFVSVTMVAYGFARLRAPGKNILFMILLSTMMLPWPVMLIPQYEIFQDLGMINTLWPLFVRAFFGNAFLIFLLRQFFMGIPMELEDAARIDGASTFQVLWSVMLPLSKPALATIGIFTFWWTWNSFLEPYVYLSSVRHFTVSLGLGFFRSQYNYTFHLLMAASVIAILPMVLLFFFAQRYFIEGIQLTGLKG